MRNSLREVYIKRPRKEAGYRDFGYGSASSRKRLIGGIKFGHYADRVKQVLNWKLGYGIHGLNIKQVKRIRNLCRNCIKQYRKDHIDRIDKLIKDIDRE